MLYTLAYTYRNLIMSLVGGLLLFAAWPLSAFTFLIFIAWIPLLWLELVTSSKRLFLTYTYITMLVWNVCTTWWVWNASAPGALAAFIANSMLMCIPWLGYSIIKRRLGSNLGFCALVSFWMCFESIHLMDWGLSWPWLTLGNVFSTNPSWIQWYEYTGTSGGTMWVLLINIFIYKWLFLKVGKSRSSKDNYWAILFLIAPIIFSWTLQVHKRIPNNRENIVVVQPNIDPYEKVSGATGSFEAQLHKLIQTTEKAIDSNTRLVLWPETALFMQNGINETELKPNQNFLFNPLWSFLRKYPKAILFTGIESFNWLSAPTPFTKKYNDQFYEAYNAAAILDSSGSLSFYHKSMLVPGVETLPWFLKFLDNWFEKFGGTTAGYARQTERKVLIAGGYKLAPSICYESIYGDFMRQYIKKGADFICIITNDGWWKNTPGHQQHMNYARLRAIENRTWVARSANTGISCFINPYGEIIELQAYNTTGAIKHAIPSRNFRKTFFSQYGDVLSKIMMILSMLIVAYIIVEKAKNFIRKRRVKAC
ncbi:MAG: apolipoprotein N-acyltransferase [Bacteroidota bacterium]|jgi:apolipoprotein N-acyltransferase